MSDSPPPDKYQIGSTFDYQQDHSARVQEAFGSAKKTYCFGAGREDFEKAVTNTSTMYPDSDNPGPGYYTDETTLIGVNARKTAIKERKFYMDTVRYAKKNDIPGPGCYEDNQALHRTGVYVSSQN